MPERWQKLVETTQLLWHHREILMEMVWMILVLIPKGNTDTRRIGLLELLWKVVEAIIDTRLRESFFLHNALHRFCAGRGMGTAILKLNLEQEFDRVDQYPLFLVFLEPQKAYDTVYGPHLLTTLEGYGAGLRICKLLLVFW